MCANLLKIVDLHTHFQTALGVVKAVAGVNLKENEGEAVGIVGESGSGKSTLAFSILRLVPPPGKIVRGQILFKGKNLLELPEEEMRQIRGGEIGIVFQDPMSYLNPLMKIKDQIGENLLNHTNAKKSDVQENVIRLLREVGIASPERVANSYPYELSGGMRQRVVLSIAISCKPSLVILDEPTTSVDVTTEMQIIHLLLKLKKEYNITYILITHSLGLASVLCNRIYVMYCGKILETAHTSDLIEKPLHPYTVGLLNAAQSIMECKEKLISINGSVPDLTARPSGCIFHPRCPRSHAICVKQEPPLKVVEPGRKVRCFFC